MHYYRYGWQPRHYTGAGARQMFKIDYIFTLPRTTANATAMRLVLYSGGVVLIVEELVNTQYFIAFIC